MKEIIAESGGPRKHRDCLNKLISETQGDIYIASAYVTESTLFSGVGNRRVRLLCSLKPHDIASGATSPKALSNLQKSGVECRAMGESKTLHAKTYIFGDEVALVTSANLTQRALASNIEVGIKFDGKEVGELLDWFREMWANSEPLSEEKLIDLEGKAKLFQSENSEHKKRIDELFHLENAQATISSTSKSFRNTFDRAKKYFLCNTNRRFSGVTNEGTYFLEEKMKANGFAAAWENFNYPDHMRLVEQGDCILMFAKGVGIIGVGIAKGVCEVMDDSQVGRVFTKADSRAAKEWRVPVDWKAWVQDSQAFSWDGPRFTFGDITKDKYADLRSGVKRHFSGDS